MNLIYSKELEHLTFWNQAKNSKLLWNEYKIHDQQNHQNSTTYIIFLTEKIAGSSCFDHHWFSRYVYVFCVDLKNRCGKNSQKRTIIELSAFSDYIPWYVGHLCSPTSDLETLPLPFSSDLYRKISLVVFSRIFAITGGTLKHFSILSENV